VGAWASLVLIGMPQLVGPLEDWEDAGDVAAEFDGGWALWRFPDTDIAEEPIELLDGLVAATGRPALTAYLIDGDQLDIAGFSWQHGLWRALAPPSAPLDARLVEHFEDESPPPDRLDPNEATAAALRWAAAAGRSGNRAVLHQLFAQVDKDIFGGERAVGHLLGGLGFVDV
jgi:hypothetical protein